MQEQKTEGVMVDAKWVPANWKALQLLQIIERYQPMQTEIGLKENSKIL